MRSLQIRRAESRDIDDILRLLLEVDMVHHRARPDLFKGPATKYSREELEELLTDPERPVFAGLDENGGFLGYIFLQLERIEESPLRTGIRTLYIDDLCVEEAARGQKVGERLFQHALAYARSMGCYNVTLHVWNGNDGAQKFYERMGMKNQYSCLETIL